MYDLVVYVLPDTFLSPVFQCLPIFVDGGVFALVTTPTQSPTWPHRNSQPFVGQPGPLVANTHKLSKRTPNLDSAAR